MADVALLEPDAEQIVIPVEKAIEKSWIRAAEREVQLRECAGPEVARYAKAKPEDLGVEVVARPRTLHVLDRARVIEREVAGPGTGGGLVERLESERRPGLRHRVDRGVGRQPLRRGRARREWQADHQAGDRSAKASHGAEKIARLTNPRTGPYVVVMTRSNSAWFFYFTNAGAARCASGVGSVV